jgi:hypothetical protein
VVNAAYAVNVARKKIFQLADDTKEEGDNERTN